MEYMLVPAPSRRKDVQGLRLTELPSEIIIPILAFLDLRSLLRCTAVSRLLRSYILDSSLLQYQIELEACGMSDGLPRTRSSVSDRLVALRSSQDAWGALQWRRSDVFPLRQLFSVWELSGGVFAHGERDGMILHIQELPSVVRGSSGRTWTIEDPSMKLRDFTMDPSQDLLVLIEERDDETSSNPPFHIHFRRLSDGEPHPAAQEPVVIHPVDSRPTVSLSFSAQILENHLGLLFKSSGRSQEMVIWDWTSGVVKTRLPVQTPGSSITSFCILNHKYFVVTCLRLRASLSLDVYSFDWPKSDPRLIRSFLLPSLQHGSVATAFQCRSEPSTRSFFQHIAPFSSRPENRIIVISIRLVALGMNSRPDFSSIDLLVFLHTSTLIHRLHTLLEPVIIPWEDWGPNETRCMSSIELESTWVCYTHGQRFVTLADDDEYGDGQYSIRVFDFNPFAISRAKHGTSKKVQGSQVIVTHPIAIPAGVWFEHDIISYLPYISTTTNERFDYNAVMLDEEHVFGVMPSGEKLVEVLTF